MAESRLASLRLFAPDKHEATASLKTFLNEIANAGPESMQAVGAATGVAWEAGCSAKQYMKALLPGLARLEPPELDGQPPSYNQ